MMDMNALRSSKGENVQLHGKDAGISGAGDLFVPFMFLMFNAGDLLGRGLASLGPWARHSPGEGVLIAYALGRVALLVGLMFCNVITPHQWRLPRLIRSDMLQTARPSPV